MEKQTFGLGLLFMFMLMGLVPLSSANVKTSSAVIKSSDTPRESPALIKVPPDYPDLTTILRRYLDDRDDDQSASWDASDPRHTMEVESLIAILPDPVESRFGDVFDDLVESLQRAVEADGFVLGPFVLTWNKEPAIMEKNPLETNKASKADDKDYLRPPSIMLFRSPGHSHLLVVFLVGETPRSGVELPALTSALEQSAKLSDILGDLLKRHGAKVCCAQQPSTIRIMGPTFSGSAYSLGYGLRDWVSVRKAKRLPTPGFTIISGSANAIDKERLVGGLDATFSATMVPVQAALDALLKWLGPAKAEEIAVLSESDTVYGERLRSTPIPIGSPTPTTESSRHTRSLKPSGEIGSPTTATTASPTSSATPVTLKLTQFTFPLHIADLEHAAKESELRAGNGMRSNPSFSLAHQTLPLAAEQTGPADDVIPVFSSAQTNSMDVSLWELLETIHERQIRYSIIGASDVHDVDYLAKQLRTCCPGTRIITLSSDLLYLNSDINPDLAGAIVASTYPLISQNQTWTPPAESSPIYQFPSEAAEGVFNATVALLGKSNRMIEYGEPFDEKSHKPPLWLTVVGRGDVWPLATLPIDDVEGYLFSKSNADASGQVRAPSGFKLFFVAVSLGFSLVWSAMIVMLFPSPDRTSGDLARLRARLPVFMQIYFGESVLQTNRRLRRIYLLLLAWSLLVTYAMLLFFCFMPIFNGWPPVGPFWAMFRFYFILLCSVVSVFCGSKASAGTLWLALQPSDRSRVPSWVGICSSILMVGVAAAVFGASKLVSVSPAFLFLRAATLGDGVSPLVPLLWVAAAGILMLASELRRLNLSELRGVRASFLKFDTDSFLAADVLEGRVRKELSGSFPSTVYVIPAFVTILGFYCYIHYELFLRCLDGTYFGSLFFLLGLVIYLAIGSILIRLVMGWLSIRTMLRNLYWHPSRHFYATLHNGTPDAENTVTDFLSADPALVPLQISLEQARLLARSARTEPDFPLSDVERSLADRSQFIGKLTHGAEQSLDTALAADAQGDWRKAARQRYNVRKWLEKLSHEVAVIFEPLWALDERPSNKAGTPTPAVVDAGGNYIASRVADLLRQVLPQVSVFAFSATAGVIMILFAVSSYPFPAQGGLVLFNWVFVIMAVVICAFVYFSMNRDRVLSLLSGSTPGRISWNATLVLQIFTHAVVPILAVLGAAFPDKLVVLSQWASGLFAHV